MGEGPPFFLAKPKPLWYVTCMTGQNTEQEIPAIVTNDSRWEAARLQNKGICREIAVKDLPLRELLAVYEYHDYEVPKVIWEKVVASFSTATPLPGEILGE